MLLSHSTNILSLLLPAAIFLGIVFAFGRMYKDHEIAVMKACGVGYREFYLPVAIVVLPVFVFSVYASLWLNPAVQRHAQAIADREANRHEFQQIKPGQFNRGIAEGLVFYMESISEDKLELRDIIIGQSGSDKKILETARRGRQKIDESSGDLFLVVGPGERYEGELGSAAHKIVSFDAHGILLQNKGEARSSRTHREQMTLTELWSAPRIRDQVELHWRIAMPAVLVVLALVAVPLAYIAPRQGRFGKFGYALLVYIVYLNLMALTRAQLETGKLPMVVNFWWVHAGFVVLALALLYRRNRGFFPVRVKS